MALSAKDINTEKQGSGEANVTLNNMCFWFSITMLQIRIKVGLFLFLKKAASMLEKGEQFNAYVDLAYTCLLTRALCFYKCL